MRVADVAQSETQQSIALKAVLVTLLPPLLSRNLY